MKQLIKESLNETPPYRIMGTDADYSERDVIDINEESFSNLKVIFDKSNLSYNLLKMVVEQGRYYISEDKELKVEEPKYSSYLNVVLNELRDRYGSVVFKSHFNLYEFKDNNFGIVLINNHSSSSYVCMGYDGLLKFFEDRFVFN